MDYVSAFRSVMYSFSFTFFIATDKRRRLSAPALESISDELMHAMLERETDLVFNSSVGAILSKGEVDIDLSVEAPNEAVAAATARDFVIESIRATETPIKDQTMWIMFGAGFVLGVLVMWLWATLAVAGRTDDLEELWRHSDR